MIQIFENERFGQIRTVMKDGEPWFVLADVCRALEISNSRMVAGRLDSDELMSVKLTSGGQRREMTVINESGLYAVIIRSDKPQAQSFRKWLTSEVLPTIRRTGGYVSNADMFVDEYLSFADEPIKNLFKLQFEYIGQLNERIVSLHKRGIFSKLHDFDRAAKFYQLIRYSYASSLDSYGSQPHSIWGDFPQIDMAARRLQKVVIENKDFEKLIRQYDRPVSFFYCDPPYYATENYYKDVGFTAADHIRLRDPI